MNKFKNIVKKYKWYFIGLGVLVLYLIAIPKVERETITEQEIRYSEKIHQIKMYEPDSLKPIATSYIQIEGIRMHIGKPGERTHFNGEEVKIYYIGTTADGTDVFKEYGEPYVIKIGNENKKLVPDRMIYINKEDKIIKLTYNDDENKLKTLIGRFED